MACLSPATAYRQSVTEAMHLILHTKVHAAWPDVMPARTASLGHGGEEQSVSSLEQERSTQAQMHDAMPTMPTDTTHKTRGGATKTHPSRTCSSGYPSRLGWPRDNRARRGTRQRTVICVWGVGPAFTSGVHAASPICIWVPTVRLSFIISTRFPRTTRVAAVFVFG